VTVGGRVFSYSKPSCDTTASRHSWSDRRCWRRQEVLPRRQAAVSSCDGNSRQSQRRFEIGGSASCDGNPAESGNGVFETGGSRTLRSPWGERAFWGLPR
jgi:hypothetical protein